MEPPAKSKNRVIAAQWGLLAALASCIFTTINNKFLLGNYGLFRIVYYIINLLPLAFFVLIGLNQRKKRGGYIGFKESFQSIFIAVVIVVVVTNAYQITYAKVIDKDIFHRTRDSIFAYYKKSGHSEADIQMKIGMNEDDYKKSFTVKTLLLSAARDIEFYGLLGLIAAAIVRKKAPAHLLN